MTRASIAAVRERLRASASGYVRLTKFGPQDRPAINELIRNGEVEIFESPLGRAYRLTKKAGHP